MAFLREAVEKQKIFLIEQLIACGEVKADDTEIYQKPLSELVHDYEKFCIDYEQKNPDSLKFTRYNPYQQDEEKPSLH
ncbi:Fur-regulated basic protein FbpA [Gracilibacillus oryzae]|uniref:Fur-regulated basic protein FbpA n=1 Tax=Gracilibacillus oryzae TaxID=1672701 RepID=A0A7C8GTW1_9BACI|nr:Fur-regulated basic protein FbpA [Gracilibacillus oryzae]KAB8137560.1 Fur-regulated basic protein FbpA [Gracilibacillus oryzae]